MPQHGGPGRPEAEAKWVAVSGGPKGSVAVRILRPKGAAGPLPAVVYVHGADRVTGLAHDRLVRELAVGAHCAVLFPDYTPAPAAGYGLALEECYAVARWVDSHGAGYGMDRTRLAVAGDAVGGGIGVALALLAKERGDFSFTQLLLLYPLPPEDRADPASLSPRSGSTSFPHSPSPRAEGLPVHSGGVLRAAGQRPAGLPAATVVTAQADAPRDEGGAYAAALRAAGVAVTTVRCGSGSLDDLVRPGGSLPPGRAGEAADVMARVVAALRCAFAAGR
ncbi:alpha/beta hydrolase fold domain-containing protein [Streptomyces sp. NPDC059582]|uniref:alpha/beta hydrolase n=1 Tax=Streptomyces sp. NPDC059582 TaxID=3346875 RepID=UPI003687974F